MTMNENAKGFKSGEIQWGPAIAVDGKRPGWLERHTPLRWYGSGMTQEWWDKGGGFTTGEQLCWGDNITSIALPADHPHYRQTEAEIAVAIPQVADGIPKGMKAWHGGETPPEDWAGPDSPALLRSGFLVKGGYRWTHNSAAHPEGTAATDIIAYTPQPTPQADTKPDLTARMESLVLRMKETNTLFYAEAINSLFEEAHAIAALLAKPVDPDLQYAHALIEAGGWAGEHQISAEVAVEMIVVARRDGRALALAGEKEA